MTHTCHKNRIPYKYYNNKKHKNCCAIYRYLSPSLQLGQVQATLRTLVFGVGVPSWSPELWLWALWGPGELTRTTWVVAGAAETTCHLVPSGASCIGWAAVYKWYNCKEALPKKNQTNIASSSQMQLIPSIIYKFFVQHTHFEKLYFIQFKNIKSQQIKRFFKILIFFKGI